MPSVTQEQLLPLQISSSHLLAVTFSTYPSQGFSDACGHGCCEMLRLAWAAGCNAGAVPAAGGAGRLAGAGRARSMGRRPNHTKAQGSLGRRAADKAQLPGRVVDPWAGTGRCSPSLPKANSSQPQLVFPPCPLNNCPSVRVPHSRGAVSSEGTKARRGFVPYTLPSISSMHQPRWDERSLSVPRPARGQALAAGGRRAKGGCSSASLPLSISESCESETRAQSHRRQTGLSYRLEKSSRCLFAAART